MQMVGIQMMENEFFARVYSKDGSIINSTNVLWGDFKEDKYEFLDYFKLLIWPLQDTKINIDYDDLSKLCAPLGGTLVINNDTNYYFDEYKKELAGVIPANTYIDVFFAQIDDIDFWEFMKHYNTQISFDYKEYADTFFTKNYLIKYSGDFYYINGEDCEVLYKDYDLKDIEHKNYYFEKRITAKKSDNQPKLIKDIPLFLDSECNNELCVIRKDDYWRRIRASYYEQFNFCYVSYIHSNSMGGIENSFSGYAKRQHI